MEWFEQVPGGCARVLELIPRWKSSAVADAVTITPRLIALSPGIFYRWMRQTGKLGDQHKVPRVTNDRTTAESLLADAAGEIGQSGLRPGVLDPAEARP